MATPEPVPTAPATLVSIRLITHDVARLVGFYERVSGVPATWSTPAFAELSTPAGTVAIGSTATMPQLDSGSARPTGTAAVADDVIIEFLVDDVDGEHRRLTGEPTDVVAAPTTMPWGNRSLLLRDPDGHLVNLFTPVTAAAAAKFAHASSGPVASSGSTTTS